MAKYTTELRTIIDSGINIFDFDYPFFDETKRAEFEQGFIDHFYFNEIGAETVGRFLHYLKVKFREEIPYFNKMCETALIDYDVKNNYDATETLTRTTTGKNTTTGKATGESTSKAITSETPDGSIKITNIEGELYASTGAIGKNTDSATNTGESLSTAGESYELRKVGNIGVMTATDLIDKHIATQDVLQHVYRDFYNQCDDLFMQIF